MSTEEPTPKPKLFPRDPSWPNRERIEGWAREFYQDDVDKWGGSVRDMLFILLVDVGDVYLQELERSQSPIDLEDPTTFDSGFLAGSAIDTVLNGLNDHLTDRQEGNIERVS